jgi:organic hydroperoxide reductase OsmC/OhrA
MKGHHHYQLKIEWTGNAGTGTTHAAAYQRSHTMSAAGKQDLHCSSDPAFRGDPTKYNPEEFLVAAISSCHMLWYLHLCADAGIVVTAYIDNPEGNMVEATPKERGRFTDVTLNPVITITAATMNEKAQTLHEKAHEMCFIANSCNFPVYHKPVFIIE